MDVGLAVAENRTSTPTALPTRTSTRLSRLSLGIGLLAAAVVWPLFRQAEGRPWDSIWAEDGMTFVQDANTMPLHETLFRGYAGYSHLLPRLLVSPTRYLPVEWIAAYVAIAGAVLAALIALFVYRACGSHVPDAWARLALAGACVLSPVLAFENEATLVNLFWILTFATFWAIVSRQDRPADVAARGLIAFLGTASSPIACIYLPLVVAVTWTRRRRSDVVVAGAYLAGVVAQVGAMLATDDPADRASSSLADFGSSYAVRVLASAGLGEAAAMDLWTAWGAPFAWLTMAVAAVAAIAIWAHVDRGRTRTALVAVVCSVPLFAVPLFLRGSSLSRLVEGTYNQAGTRYFVTPVLLVVSAAAIFSATASRRWLPKALLAQVVVVGVASLGVGASWRLDGPSWIAGVPNAEEACVTTPEPGYGVPVAPGGVWQSWLPCSRLAG